MTRASRILGLLFFMAVAYLVAVVVTDGQPGTLLSDLDEFLYRVTN